MKALRNFPEGFYFLAVFANFVAWNKVVDFLSRMLAFRGAGGEPPQACACGVSPVPLIPHRKAESGAC